VISAATVSTTVVIAPSHNRWEGSLLIGALLALVALTWLYARSYGIEDKPQVILDWQVSAFSGLQGSDQAIYNELLVAADEIYFLQYYNGYWPDDSDFQEALLPPFYRDLSWERNGSITWTLKDVIQEGEAQGLTLYHGAGGTLDKQGAWLLVIDHKHAGNSQINGSSIWYHSDRNAPIPDTSKVASMILHDWKQVVPYMGRDEVLRLQGN
jgi:hypothetical protein